MAESYQTGELPVDTNHEMIAHAEQCAGCRGESAARAALRETLRQAIEQTPALAPDPHFVTAVRASILRDRRARGRFGGPAWLAIAAAAVMVLALGWLVRPAPQHVASPAVSALAGHAAGDHRYCALEHALEDPVITLEEAARRYDPVYVSLREVVAEAPPIRERGMQVVDAHWCVFRGRSFGHVVARRGDRLVSVLLTPVEEGSAAVHQVASCQSTDGLQVTCFNARGHAVFVVSDGADVEILQLARALAPVLQAYLARS